MATSKRTKLFHELWKKNFGGDYMTEKEYNYRIWSSVVTDMLDDLTNHEREVKIIKVLLTAARKELSKYPKPQNTTTITG